MQRIGSVAVGRVGDRVSSPATRSGIGPTARPHRTSPQGAERQPVTWLTFSRLRRVTRRRAPRTLLVGIF
jgi:hypothetical protein